MNSTTSYTHYKPLLSIVLAILMLSMPLSVAHAQADSSESTTQIFDLPAMALGDAFFAITKAFDVNILADERLLDDKSSSVISDAKSAEDALLQALHQSGLALTRSANGAFLIKQAQATDTTTLSETASLQEVEVVTIRGQRMEQTEYETSTSVSVFIQETLNSFPGAQDTEDLIARIPNITASTGTQGQFAVRGSDSTGPLFGGNAFIGGQKARVTTTVDGYPLTFNEFIYGSTSLYDIQQVEVYRGPQTTTQGANAIAGAIQVFTNDPTFDFEAGVLLETGNRDRLQTAGYISGPIAENELAFRISADQREIDSFVDFQGQENTIPGLTIGEMESHVYRGKLLWTPSDLPGFSAKLTITDSEGNRPLDNVSLDNPDELRFFSTNVGDLKAGSTSSILDLSYEFGDGLTLVSQSSYADFDLNYFIASAAANNFVFAETDGTRLSQEVYLTMEPSNGGISALFGAFYTRTEQDDEIFFASLQELNDVQEALGIYSRVAVDVTDKLTVTGGLRYQYDDQVREGVFFFPVAFDESFDAVLPSLEIAYDATDTVRIGVDVSKGFNPGGFTVSFIDGSQTLFDEETVWTYDAFVRSRLFDGALVLNGNLFYSDFDGFQKNTVVGFDANNSPVIRIDNVDKAEMYGIELAADLTLTDSFAIYASLGLLEATFSELVAPNELGSFDFARAPSVTAFVGAEWRPFENFMFTTQARYTDDYFSEDNNIPANRIDSFTLVDAAARYDFGGFEVYAFVENLTDKITPVRIFGSLAAGNPGFANVTEPRTFGVGVEFSY